MRQMDGAGSDLLGPAVTVAHRLLKNRFRERIGFQPYLYLTDVAATALGLSQVGLPHGEEYPDAGLILGRIVELGGPRPEDRGRDTEDGDDGRHRHSRLIPR